MELVSVVIPFFNAAETLRTAVLSALGQTYRDIEVIVCDDGSSDSGLDVLEGIEDPRLRRTKNQTNLGVGRSRDLAIGLAKGKWIAVLDADDAYKPDRIARMLQAARHEKDVIVFDDIDQCLSIDNVLHAIGPMRGPRAFEADGVPIDVPTAEWLRSKRLLIKPLIPARLISDHSIRHSTKPYAEDAEFFIKLLKAGGKLRYLPEALYSYRKTPGSASSISTRHELMIDVLKEARSGFSGDVEIIRALDERISYEAHLNRYFDIVRRIKKRRSITALRLLFTDTRLTSEFLGRTVDAAKEKLKIMRFKG